ncbi:unnamed protein product [Mytilus coruscus]|uniref:C-type lectin domain-containing protein n=1 Tax=Mytilus coruscus TaxID=42192 RepID=A0A6J8CM30_MYTCO|nr:unnamed protein product [Mytilus coruscus]
MRKYRDKIRLLIIFVECIIGLNIANGIVQPDTLLLLTQEAEAPSGIGALVGFLLGLLTAPKQMSDCTLVTTGQMNMMNQVSTSNLMTESTVPSVMPMSAATSPALPQTICSCPSGFTRIPPDSGNCYSTCDSNSDWLRAVLECRRRGAYLWEPNTQEEVNAVAPALLDSSGDRFWTGATDQGNEDLPSFVLGSGNPFTLSAGSDGPASDCVAYEPTNFVYRTCHIDRKCVCERVCVV